MTTLRGSDADVHAALGARLGALYVGFTGDDYIARFGGRLVSRRGTPAIYVAHHSAGSHKHTGADLWRFHVQRMGWDTTGYHFVVRHDGTVEMMVPPSYMTYGAGPRWNPTTVHVCLPGNYHTVHEPTLASLDGLYQVLCVLDDEVGYRPWKGHRDIRPTVCPGDRLIPHVRRMSHLGALNPRPDGYST